MRDLRARLDRIERNAPKPRAALVYYRAGEEEAPDLAPGELVVPLFGDDDPLGPGAAGRDPLAVADVTPPDPEELTP